MLSTIQDLRGGRGQKSCHGTLVPRLPAHKGWAWPQGQSRACDHMCRKSDPSQGCDPSGVRSHGLEGEAGGPWGPTRCGCCHQPASGQHGHTAWHALPCGFDCVACLPGVDPQPAGQRAQSRGMKLWASGGRPSWVGRMQPRAVSPAGQNHHPGKDSPQGRGQH